MAIALMEDVWKIYTMGDEAVYALRGVDMAIEEGENVSIVGPSGPGKSTMLNMLGCLDRPTHGEYVLGGVRVSQADDNELSDLRSRALGFIFQSYNLIPQLNVLENIEVPLLYQGWNERQSREVSQRVAADVGLGDRMYHRPYELSGGQQQRVGIARALATDPLVLLADEPTGNLDSNTGVEIMSLFDRLAEAGKTIITVTHDVRIAQRATRSLCIVDGQLYSEEDSPFQLT